MLYKHLKISVLLTLLLVSFGLQAQVSVNAAGGNAMGDGGSVSFSVGQMTFSANVGPNGSVTEGVQQPYEISVLSVAEQAENISLSVYPNPSTDYLCLTTSDEISDLSYQLFDMSGRLLKSGKVVANQTSIDMQDLVPATYFVKVNQGNETVKSFKIIKK